jgi:isopenicillin N synthase-like dioxygenase
MISAARTAGKAFFELSRDTKAKYATQVGGRGWLAIGAEANGYSEGTETPPDLKESFIAGPEGSAGEEVEVGWFMPNKWPTETPELQSILEDYFIQMRLLADAMLEICSLALKQDVDFFAKATKNPSWSFQINWYPSVRAIGQAAEGQYRIGPHTDFGTLTLLDRQPGDGGLQIDIDGEGWVDAPYIPGALVVNTGDLLARWTGERWKSNRHRVLPPPKNSPEEELMSLVYFFEADPEAIVQPLAPPLGLRDDLPSVSAGDFIRQRYDVITMS